MIKYIHYGSNKFDAKKFKEIRNNPFFTKPFGGLWASRIDSKHGWKDWCISEGYMTERLKKSFEFTLKENSRILKINDVKQLEDLPKQERDLSFGALTSPFVSLDFEKLKENYDAIEVFLSEERNYDFFNNLNFNLMGWDCDSILIMNPEIIKEK